MYINIYYEFKLIEKGLFLCAHVGKNIFATSAYYSRIATDMEEDIQCNRMSSVLKAIRTLAGKVTSYNSFFPPYLEERRQYVHLRR